MSSSYKSKVMLRATTVITLMMEIMIDLIVLFECVCVCEMQRS